MSLFPGRLARAALTAFLLAALALPASSASLSGAYLAAMQADIRDDYAAAADYYDQALALDGDNTRLIQGAAVIRVAKGDIAGALELARQLAAEDPGHQLAALILLADALKRRDFEAAAGIVESAGEAMNPLLRGLVSGWIEVGRSDFAAAQEEFDSMDSNDALSVFGQYHKALALALAGDFISAGEILAGGEEGPLHLSRAALVAHAQILAQMAREADAIALLDEALSSGVPDTTLIDLRDRLAAGEEVRFDQITQASDGAADAFLTLADALSAQEAGRIALVQVRLASYIRPDLVEAQLLAAGILEEQSQFKLAAEALTDVPSDSPWFVTTELRRAEIQRASGDEEAGIATLTALTQSHPEEIEAHSALGDALRSVKRFEESAAAYTRAVELIETPMPGHWALYYTRGIAYERAGNWQAAEADFRRALELQPDQPLVLNYLGYSMVEKGRNLDEALDMIERAVAGLPDDGYIIDSLGWVLYRLGRYEEAVPHMLRAVELVPVDPVINDHLGDVLWMVGRRREAEFQWRRALSFGPSDDLDMDRIRMKLENGLDQVLAEEQSGTDG